LFTNFKKKKKIDKNIDKNIEENYIVDIDNIKNFLSDFPIKFYKSFNWASNDNQYQRICTTPVKEQGTCGCCWACVITILIESAYYRNTLPANTSPPTILSTQQIIDCLSANPVNTSEVCKGCDGCSVINPLEIYLGSTGRYICTDSVYPLTANKQMGSKPDSFLEWIIKIFGRRPAYDYPGCQQRQNCGSVSPNRIWVPPMEIIRFSPKNLDENLLQKSIFTLGPIYISAQVPFKFQIQGAFFKNYIYSGPLDKGGAHAMILTGWGVTLKGEKYWIVQNSWGNSWGNNGFVWLKNDFNIKYLKDNITEMLAIKIQRNCPNTTNPIINITIDQAIQDDPSDITRNNILLSFRIIVYFPNNSYINSVTINIPSADEKNACIKQNLIDNNGNILMNNTNIISDPGNYYYDQYKLKTPTNIDMSKRWFIEGPIMCDWDNIIFTSTWNIDITINDKNNTLILSQTVYIDWSTQPPTIITT